jgi:hypothetical protein
LGALARRIGETMDYVVLKDELDTDPLVRGYSGMSDQQAANDLNSAYVSVNRDTMTNAEVLENIDPDEFALLTAVEVSMVNAVLSPDSVDPFGNAQAILLKVFTAGSNTINALAAARVATISRAEDLGLPRVNAGHVAYARAGGTG